MDKERTAQLVSKIEGWLSRKEGELLYEIAKKLTGRGVVVEIGSWKGRSTIWLGKGSEAGKRVKIFAIDPHTGADEQKRKMGGEIWTFEEFKANIKRAGIEKLVVPIVETSEDAAKDWGGEPIELLWIDGAHDYEFVKLDWRLWSPHIIEGGWVAFHDALAAGPGRVISESILTSRAWRLTGRADSILYFHKKRISLFRHCAQLFLALGLRAKFIAGRLWLPSFIKNALKKILSLILK